MSTQSWLEPDSPLDADALTVAMSIAPAAYARNRMFGFYKDPEVRRARRRASTLRGLVRQLAGGQGAVDGLTLERAPDGRARLRYRIASLSAERCSDLSDLEVACLRYMASRANVASVPILHFGPDDRTRLYGALRRLAVGLALQGFSSPGLPPELCR